MKLQNVEKANVPREKITDYLLSRTHKDGQSKAKFFLAFGFTVENWELLANALKLHAATHEIVKIESSPFGTRFVIEGEINAPDEREPEIRAVWFVENDGDAPRFVTAYPLQTQGDDDD